MAYNESGSWSGNNGPSHEDISRLIQDTIKNPNERKGRRFIDDRRPNALLQYVKELGDVP